VDYDSPSDSNDYFYLPSWILGRVNVGGALPGTSGFPPDMSNPNLGYAMADQFNHAMRYPDEQNLYSILCNIAQNQGNAAPQISWRMLLELLNENDPSVQNAIVLNLHGELVPVPPIRNYSDAAKDPLYFQAGNGQGLGARSYRVVSQPEGLYYPTGVTVGVNVYAYDANPSEIPNSLCITCTAINTDADPREVVNATLFIPGATVSNLYQVIRTQGNSQTPYYRFISGTGGAPFLPYNGNTVITDASSATTLGATFYADNFTPSNRSVSGLRIQLLGITPTARPYFGPEFSLTKSP